MKKLLVFLLASSQIFAEEVQSESFFSRLHQDIMDRWNALSDMHKMILASLAVVAAIWILCRLMSCRTNKCCGCTGNCNCLK